MCNLNMASSSTQRYAVSLRWSALTEDNKTVESGMLTNWAQTVPELQKAFTDNHAPMQSVVMADTLGEVAFQAVGKLPTVRHKMTSGVWRRPPAGWPNTTGPAGYPKPKPRVEPKHH
jgi:acyl-homoserine lactone acylase PvdQ